MKKINIRNIFSKLENNVRLWYSFEESLAFIIEDILDNKYQFEVYENRISIYKVYNKN